MRQVTNQNNISVILTPKTSNRKTGNMIQTWIVRNDMLPTDACKSGLDSAVCGDCPHRNSSCYVNVGQAPQSVYKAMKRGSYSEKQVETKGKLVRCGAYGDPAFIDISTWKEILEGTKGHTGYTHQWKTCSPDYSSFLMASCDSPKEREDAKAMGYRTFRVRREGEPLLDGEINCLADTSDKIQCETCLKCDGGSVGKDISITVHGSRKKNF